MLQTLTDFLQCPISQRNVDQSFGRRIVWWQSILCIWGNYPGILIKSTNFSKNSPPKNWVPLSLPWLWTTYLNKTIFNSFKRNFTCGANVMSLPLPFPFDKNVPYLILRCPSTSGYGLPPPPCPKPLWEAICIQLAFHLLIIRN